MNRRTRFKQLLSIASLLLGAASLPLLPACAARADGTLTVAANGSVMPMLKMLIDDFATQSPGSKATLLYPPAGSGGAIKGVALGRVDVGVAARAPRPGEAGPGVRAVPWARTAFVIVANHPGAQKGYTLAELAAIWSGAALRWPDGQPFRLVLRSPEDADILALRAMSAEMDRAVDIALSRPGLPRADNDLRNLEMLAKVPGAIGGSTLGLLISSGSRLAALPVGGVAPGARSLEDGSYPYQRTLFLIGGGRPHAVPFITYLHSARAARLLERNGYLAERQ